jgi:hypothetical protein
VLSFPKDHRHIFTGRNVVTGLEQRKVLVKISPNADFSKLAWRVFVTATHDQICLAAREWTVNSSGESASRLASYQQFARCQAKRKLARLENRLVT